MADNSDFKNVCGVWLSEPKEGKARYMSGTLRAQDVAEILSCSNEGNGSVRLFIHKNNKRPDKKDPDYRISCCAVKDQGAQAKGKQNDVSDDLIPF